MKIRDKSSQKERPWGYGIEQKKTQTFRFITSSTISHINQTKKK
ncbi:unnamed protein product [Brassica rapa subsp. trilocularis]